LSIIKDTERKEEKIEGVWEKHFPMIKAGIWAVMGRISITGRRCQPRQSESTLEVVSKAQIRFKGKAQADRESAAYMSM
jgi:hypothetical protein